MNPKRQAHSVHPGSSSAKQANQPTVGDVLLDVFGNVLPAVGLVGIGVLINVLFTLLSFTEAHQVADKSVLFILVTLAGFSSCSSCSCSFSHSAPGVQTVTSLWRDESGRW